MSVVGRPRTKSAAVSDRPGLERGHPSINVVPVKFFFWGGGPKGAGRHKISLSLGACFACVEQKDRQEGLFFNLGFTGREANCCSGKLSAGRQRTRL